MKRRAFVRIGATLPLLGGVGAASLLGSLSLPGSAAASDYRALVCVYLNGGNDGNNTLIPLDGAYGDYANARPDLALPKDSLAKLDGASIGHSFGLGWRRRCRSGCRWCYRLGRRRRRGRQRRCCFLG